MMRRDTSSNSKRSTWKLITTFLTVNQLCFCVSIPLSNNHDKEVRKRSIEDDMYMLRYGKRAFPEEFVQSDVGSSGSSDILSNHDDNYPMLRFTRNPEQMRRFVKSAGENHMLRFARDPYPGYNHMLRFTRNFASAHNRMLRFAKSAGYDHMLRYTRSPQDEHMLRFTKASIPKDIRRKQPFEHVSEDKDGTNLKQGNDDEDRFLKYTKPFLLKRFMDNDHLLRFAS